MAVRTALVAEARQAKDRELAKAIGALRKPTRSAWLINLLARSAADEVAGLLDLGAALREAQASLSGPELRRLSGERQKAVRALARRAASLAAEGGQRVTDGQLQEVSQHLQAALADPALAEDVRAGRVTQIVTFGGFGPWEAGTGGDAAAGTGAGAAQVPRRAPMPGGRVRPGERMPTRRCWPRRRRGQRPGRRRARRHPAVPPRRRSRQRGTRGSRPRLRYAMPRRKSWGQATPRRRRRTRRSDSVRSSRGPSRRWRTRTYVERRPKIASPRLGTGQRTPRERWRNCWTDLPCTHGSTHQGPLVNRSSFV